MYRPASKWSWAYVGIAILQLLIVLTFESYIFAKFEGDLTAQGNSMTQGRTIPTFLTLYIFGFIYQMVLVWDGLRLKNTIQIFGIVLMNVGFVIYGAVQMDQINQAIFQLSSQGDLKETSLELWPDVKPFLIAIPCVTALGTVLFALVAWKLNDEFAWTIYKHISADLRMKRRYLTYQVYIALLKFDFFFFLGFTIQFVVIITGGRTETEFALTIAAIPVTIVILLLAAFWTRRESLVGMIVVIFLYFCGLAYFIFKMVRMYSASHGHFYAGARKELTTFAVITIVLILMTIVNACMCAYNFNKGLKPYVTRRKLESAAEKGRYSTGTELAQGSNGKLAPTSSRMSID